MFRTLNPTLSSFTLYFYKRLRLLGIPSLFSVADQDGRIIPVSYLSGLFEKGSSAIRITERLGLGDWSITVPLPRRLDTWEGVCFSGVPAPGCSA
jgi:hypothetical protein